jgi:trans-L-3-hydroxyproline dehydratase
MRKLEMNRWRPPSDWRRITTIDSHTGGEPFRVVTGGVPELEGDTILERRRFAARHLDHLRRVLMWEPRGHADMYGGLVTPPATPEADFGILFLHNEGFSTMCGHGVIAMATVAVETGMVTSVEPETCLRMDTPAGLVTAWARVREGRVTSVRFQNVPSFVLALDQELEVTGLGSVRYDLAFGGAFYAFVEASDAGVGCGPEHFRVLIEKGRAIKQAVVATRRVEHPLESDLGFLYGVIFVGAARQPGAHSRNVCVFADGEVDRSPTGTGVSARLAIHHARGEIAADEPIVIESILGSRFTGRVVSTTTCGPLNAVIPEVEGTAHLTGRHEFLVDPADELGEGFLLR